MTTDPKDIIDLLSQLSQDDLAEAALPLPSDATEDASLLFQALGLCQPVSIGREDFPSLFNFQGDLAIVRRDETLQFLTRDGVPKNA